MGQRHGGGGGAVAAFLYHFRPPGPPRGGCDQMSPPNEPTPTPPDVSGECVRDGRVLHVFVSIGPSARGLRVAGEAAASESRCPFLCMADLEPRPAARAPLTTRIIREARG